MPIRAATILTVLAATALLALTGCDGPVESMDADQLIARLSHAKPIVRVRAAEELGRRKDPETVEPLVAALEDANSSVRFAAATALGHLGDRRAVGALTGALADPDVSVRMAAARSLGTLGGPIAIEALAAASKGENIPLRRAALSALARADEMRGLSALIAALKDPSPQVREGAAGMLGNYPQHADRVVQPLIELLAEGSVELPANPAMLRLRPPLPLPRKASTHAIVRLDPAAAAVRALARIGSPAVKPLTASLADHGSVAVRGRSARTLGMIRRSLRDRGHQAAITGPLVKALDDTDPFVRIMAVQALAGPAEDTGALLAAVRDSHPRVRAIAAWTLGLQRTARATPALTMMLRDGDSGPRMAAALSLGAIGSGASEAIGALVRALTDADPLVREAAAIALGEIGDPAAAPGLIAALADPAERTRREAIRSLGLVGGKASGDALWSLASSKDEGPAMRFAALLAMASIPDGRAVDPLVGKLESEDWRERNSAAHALCGIGDASGRSTPSSRPTRPACYPGRLWPKRCRR